MLNAIFNKKTQNTFTVYLFFRILKKFGIGMNCNTYCFFSSVLPKLPDCPSLSASAVRLRLDVKPLTNVGFLTRSRQFKRFLEISADSIPSRTSASPLSCGWCKFYIYVIYNFKIYFCEIKFIYFLGIWVIFN